MTVSLCFDLLGHFSERSEAVCYVLLIHNTCIKDEHKIYLPVCVRMLQEAVFNHSDKTIIEERQSSGRVWL